MSTDEELRNYIEYSKANFEKDVSDGDTDQVSDKYHVGHDGSRKVAQCYLLLGKINAARKWFRATAQEAAIRHREKKQELQEKYGDAISEDSPGEVRRSAATKWEILQNGMYCAMMVGDEDVMKEVAQETWAELNEPVLEDVFPPTSEEETALLAAALLDDAAEGKKIASDIADKLDELSTEYRRIRVQGLVTALTGIFDRDEEATKRGLNQLVEFHEHIVESEPGAFDKDIDFHSTAVLSLARHRDLDVRVDSEYVPEAVYELA